MGAASHPLRVMEQERMMYSWWFSFVFRLDSVQCFDTAGWVRGRAPGLQKFAAVIPKVLFWGSGLTVQKYAGETRTKLDGLQCIWRHCYIGSKRALPTGVLGRWHVTQLFTYLRTDVAQLPCPHRFVYFCVITQQDIHSDHQQLSKICVGKFLVRNVQSRGKTLSRF